MGLDLLGQARELYSYAANVEGKDTTRTSSLISVTSGSTVICCCWNSRTAISRAPWCGSFSTPRSRDLYWCAMMKSADPTLAAIAAKSEKESAYHLRHSSGMDRPARRRHRRESHRAARKTAIDDLWAYTARCSRSTTANAA